MIKAQRGTKDILFLESYNWERIEKIASNIFHLAGFSKIQTPIFEATELFNRGVGESSDIVNKEMYTFSIGGIYKKETSITLRPENTAGVVRAFIEHNLSRLSPPQKFWYFGPMFRYERPQAGRQRQFHQIGVEVFGCENPSMDAEIIQLALSFLKAFNLSDFEVEINSLGCTKCKNEYKASIKEVLSSHIDKMCEDCKIRYQKNPLRILDCKQNSCQEILELEEVKKIVLKDYICPDCKNHFETLCSYLDELNINYKINKFLVRGLDYYNRTVFEVKSSKLGSQSAILGGGRYDNLTETLGGPKTPAIGFALGVERLYSLIEKVESKKLDYFVVSNNPKEALKLTTKLREQGKSAEFDYQNRKFAKQLEKASKTALCAIILGEDEINQGYYSVKDLTTAEQRKIDSFNDLI